MNLLTAISMLVDLTNAATILLQKSETIGALIAKAQAENRDITQAELDSVVTEDDAAKVALNAAILRHQGN